MGLKVPFWNDFSGGLFTDSDSTKIGGSYSPNLNNAFATEKGSITCRKGTVKKMDQTSSSAGKKVTMLANFQRSDGTEEVLVAFDGKVKKLNMTTGAVSDLPSAISNTDASAMYGYYVYDDTLYFCNGINGFNIYDGATNTTATLTNVGGNAFKTNNFIVNDRKMYAVDYGIPTLLHRSKTDGGTAGDIYKFDYTGGSSVENSGTTRIKSGRSQITGLALLNRLLYIFTKKKVFTGQFQELGSDTLFTVPEYAGGVGAINQSSIVSVKDAVYFYDPVDDSMTQFGQRERYPDLTIWGVSDKIRNLLSEQYDFSEATSIQWRRLYLTACKSSSSAPANDIVLVFDLETKAIYKLTGWYVSCWMEYQGDLYFGSSIAPMVYKAFEGLTDDGQIIQFEYDTNTDNFGDPASYKNAGYIYVDGTITEGYKVDITAEFDFGRFTITKTIDGSNTDYIIDPNIQGYLGETPLGFNPLAISTEGGERVFQVWMRLNARKFQNVQIKVKTSNDSGVGSVSIRNMFPVRVTPDTSEPSPERII